MGVDVSVVVPTFRRPEPLREAVTSAIGQQGVRVEVLVVDDSPEGSARPAVEALGHPSVRYHRRERPTGGNPALVRNDAWPSTGGRYVHFLDDDDRVLPGAYRTLVTLLDCRPRAALAFGVIEPFGAVPEVLARQRRYFRRAAAAARLAGPQPFVMQATLLFQHAVLFCSAGLLRRSALAVLGGFDPGTAPMEDVDLYVRAAREFGAVFVDRPVLQYRTGAPSILHSRPDDARIVAAYRRIHAKYRARHGHAEFLALKLFARTVLRAVEGRRWA